MSQLSEEDAIKKADELFKEDSIEEAHELLTQYKDSTNPNMLWRLARTSRHLVQRTQDAEKRKTLSFAVRDLGKRGIEIDETSGPCHKWYAMGLSLVGDIQGAKEKLKNAYTIRDHFQKAKELDPSDPMAFYLLGMWCYTCADMSWFHRKIASTLYSTPPTSTYEEAIKNFEEAEKVEADFYSKNQLMLGKAYLKSKNKEKAKEWFDKTTEYSATRAEDKEMIKEAKEHLKSL